MYQVQQEHLYVNADAAKILQIPGIYRMLHRAQWI